MLKHSSDETLKRPWLKPDVEGAARFAIGIIRLPPKRQHEWDADLAAWAARAAYRWTMFMTGER